MTFGTTLYCGDNCNHTGPHRYPPVYTSTTPARPVAVACNCVGGPDCCIKRAERGRDEAMREEGRREERQRWLTREDDPTVTDQPVEED